MLNMTKILNPGGFTTVLNLKGKNDRKGSHRTDAFLTAVSLLKYFILQHPFITVDPFVRFLVWVFYWQTVRQEVMTYLFYEAQIQNDFFSFFHVNLNGEQNSSAWANSEICPVTAAQTNTVIYSLKLSTALSVMISLVSLLQISLFSHWMINLFWWYLSHSPTSVIIN